MRYVINLLAALGLFYSGFVNTFWGNDPYLGWAITIIASIHNGGAFVGGHGACRTHRSASALGRYWHVYIGVVGVFRGWGASR